MTAVAGQRREMLLRRELSPEQQALVQQRLRGSLQRRDAARSIGKSGATEGPLSFGQQRFWFLDQLEPGQPVYHVCFGLRLAGRLDHAAVEYSVSEIVRRHEALRTRYESRNGSVVQVVDAPRRVPVPIAEIQHTGEKEIERHLMEEGNKPFNLCKGFPIRAKLFRVQAEQHVLLFTMHHIAADAWSIDLLLKEWSTLYDARVTGKHAELPELPIQYLDFARWQQESMRDEALKEQLAYWERRLGDQPAALDLPTDYARPTMPSHAGATLSRLLGPDLSVSLSKVAQQAGASKFMVLLAAFKVLLHRYSGQNDIVAGSPMSRRTVQETENLIGLFLNVSVLRTDVSGDPTFRELLVQVRQTTLEAFANQSVPFEKIVEHLQPSRDLSRTPFFQVMFTLQDPATPPLTLEAGVRAEAFELDLDVSPYELTLLMQEKESGLEATLEYKTELFSAETIERALQHYQRLLEGIAENPDARVSELSLLTSAERRQLLVEFNPRPVDFARDKCLHELFEAEAARTPEAPAVRFGSQMLTYCELNERANQLACHLGSLEVVVETPVGICMERSPEMIIAVLAILKAGGAYVPVEPDEPTERLGLKLRDAGVALLLTHESVVKSLGDEVLANGPTVVAVDRDEVAMAINRHSSQNIASKSRPENLAYIIYTSGSTGAPKGVMVEHRSLVNHSVGMARQFELNSTDRVLQFAPLSFDVSAEEIFPTLLTGGTLVLRPAGLAVAIQDFHPFLVNEGLSVLNLPTPYWSEWMSVMEEERLTLPESLRLVIVGSDTVTREHYARWQALAGDRVRWCNAYGTTEATITTTIYEPKRGESPGCVPIGRPAMNTQVYIFDGHGELAPIGVPGEIYVGGEEVARGYLNRPDATLANFLPDRFSRRPGAKLNRTGDFGRWRADGNIEFLGRRDNQVKIRGFRIETGEVEAALLKHPGVREAAVVPRFDARGEKCLVAYVVAKEESPQLVGKLLEFLRERLPGYMVPATVMILPALPRLNSGKIAIQALPLPHGERPDLEESFVAPSDSLEQKLANVWRQVLGVERVGVFDNFFNLGGHSLLAVRLFTEIEKLTGWSLPVLTLFQSPTVKGLADALRRMQSSEAPSLVVPIRGEGSKEPLFLAHGAGGGMLWGYANLAQYLDVERPVYAFNSLDSEGLDEFTTIEEMAAHYIQEMRAVQPRGPYHLGGYCFGGLVAYEMAQQLVGRGESVALLALMNATPPNSSFERVPLTAAWLGQFAVNSWHWFRHFFRWGSGHRRQFLARKVRVWRKRLLRRGDTARRTEIDAEDYIDLSDYSPQRRRLWDVHLRAAAKYIPSVYPGRVTVLRTELHPFLCSFDGTFGWAEYAQGGVTVKVVTGAHESILNEPHVQAVAAELNHCFDNGALNRVMVEADAARRPAIEATLMGSW
jgi:amino acid adenylation domain-containing protein